MAENQDNIHDEEPSLKDLIYGIRAHFIEIKAYWKIVLLLVLLGASYFYYGAINFEKKYDAHLTFMVNSDGGPNLGAMAGLLGQFGLGGGTSDYNLDKMLELLKSRHISQDILLKKEIINGSTDYLANHIINNLDTLGKWAAIKWYKKPFIDISKGQKQRNYRFTNDTFNLNDQLSNSVLKMLYRKLTGNPDTGSNGILSSNYSEFSGILELDISMSDQNLAISLANNYFRSLSKFYIEKTIEKEQISHDVIKAKLDSINIELRKYEYQLANSRDRKRNTFSSKSKLQEIRLKNNITISIAALSKITENYEIASYALQSKLPNIQIIDAPIAPLKQSSSSKFKSIIIGAFLGGFFGVLFIVLRKLYNNALKDE